jgi:hypothetical protein
MIEGAIKDDNTIFGKWAVEKNSEEVREKRGSIIFQMISSLSRAQDDER